MNTAVSLLTRATMPLLAVISDKQSSLAPAGEQAVRIAHLWWIFFWVLIAIFVLVALVLFVALYPHRTRWIGQPPADVVDVPAKSTQQRLSNLLIGSTITTVLILFGLLFSDFFTGRAIYAVAATDSNPLTIKVRGHQWWWEVEYEDANPSNLMTTANEVHVPIGRPVKFELESSDVIHSFWVPNMHGKKDLVPGHPTTVWLKADYAGSYRGQCAEFCGLQHAHMRLEFVAEPPSRYEAWISAQRQNALDPKTDSERRGQQVFLSNQCMMCHNIEGTNARSSVGPDLTHIGSRSLLAAGSVPNTRGYLAGWIVNPQNIKPGVRMPPNQLTADDLNALLDYLVSLK